MSTPEKTLKTATIHSVCECQGKLGAELDERRYVVRGWSKDHRTGRELVAPAQSLGAEKPLFQVAWSCPLCNRNQLRSFDAASLAFRDGPRAA